MSTLLLNVFLALIWAASTSSVTLSNLVIGYVLGYLVLRLTQRVTGATPYFERSGRFISFGVYLIYHLIGANLRVVRDVLSPIDRLRPGVVQIPLAVESDIENILLANLISLMPGTLSLDVSDDRRHLYVHSMNLGDRESFERWIKDGLEPRVLGLLR